MFVKYQLNENRMEMKERKKEKFTFVCNTFLNQPLFQVTNIKPNLNLSFSFVFGNDFKSCVFERVTLAN